MRKTIVAVIAAGLLLTASAAQAKTVTRPGADYDGYANPGGCVIKAEGTEAHVNCRGSEKAARVRYRYLKEYGIKHGAAEFSAVIDRHGGDCTAADVDAWMDPPPGPRTGRVVVPAGCYVHIVEVEWSR